MRIIAGTFKGRTLHAPPGRTTRPTSDRAREALFNVLEHAPWSAGLAGRRVLDLYAGSGALGFEALSRGAAFALFVETDDAARGAIRDTIDAFGLFGVTRLHRRSAADLGMRPASLGAPFDLVFMDPPYANGLVAPTLDGLLRGQWTTPDAIYVIETGAEEADIGHDALSVLDVRTHGAAKLTILGPSGL